MAYNIINTAGSLVATVQDGTVNQSATNLTLIGKNYAGYGVFLNENYVKLLENFANSTAPDKAIAGQLWYDSANTILKVYTSGGAWKPVGTSTSSSTAPTGAITGDLWWDTTNGQLKVYSGSSWVLIGPLTTTGTGTSGPAVETVSDGTSNHVILRFYVANATVAIVSKDATFTPTPAIAGFSSIRPGLNLASPSVVAGAVFSGNATAAETLISGSSLLTAGQFLRSDIAQTTSQTFGVLNNTGLTVGASNNLTIGVASGAVRLYGAVNNADMNFVVNSGGTPTRAINVNGTTLAVTVDGALSVSGAAAVTGNLNVTNWTNMTSAQVSAALVPSGNATINLGSSTRYWNTIYASTIVGSVSSTSAASVPGITKTGTTLVGNIGQTDNRFNTIFAGTYVGSTFTGGAYTGTTAVLTQSLTVNSSNGATAIANGGTAGVGNIGALGNGFNTIFAKATSAQYADLADRLEADDYYEPGTVVEIGGLKEITRAVRELSETVFGVISTLPGFLLNGTAGDDRTHPPVAVNGRVPVRVVGQCRKGDRLVSAGNGLARAATRDEITAFNVLGRALENKTTDDEGLVEAIVKLNS